jgi:hypothetical protein
LRLHKQIRGFLAPILLFLPLFVHASLVLQNDGIVDDRAIEKINQLGNELKNKTGISVYLSAMLTLDGKKIKEYESETAKKLKSPYVLLAFSRNDTKVDILASNEVYELFDKEQILSPYPWSGTIIPLLSMHGKDLKAQESAAMLNGYADIVEQIANSKGIVLEGAIGSDNQIVYSLLKIIFYGTIFITLGLWFYVRYKRKRKLNNG